MIPLKSSHLLFATLLALTAALLPSTADAADLVPGNYYWYVPEHEKFGRTEFHSEPSFSGSRVIVTRAVRFQLASVRRGWALLEFDDGKRAYVHHRLLRNALHDPVATERWQEYQRASIFSEEPGRLEARLQQKPESESSALDRSNSSTPIWKRYKDSWGVNKGRLPSNSSGSTEPQEPTPTKPGSRHSLLPSIGAQIQPQTAGSPEERARREQEEPNR